MMQALRGVIHGKTIELTDSPEIPEGAQVDVFVRVASAPQKVQTEARIPDDDDVVPWWTDEDDRIFEMLEQDRRRWPHRELPE